MKNEKGNYGELKFMKKQSKIENSLILPTFKDMSYNDEFYKTIGSSIELPLLEQTGGTKLNYLFHQNQNASVSSTTGQFIVSLIKNIQYNYFIYSDMTIWLMYFLL